ncbi:hypothetical protein EYC84_006820 [Monilinia fructicola]|uniref:Transcription factor domain-containing protein n=1 Tax=Monilinia fructicola TaxID=38448 RepID=A0A5M9K930_MONFR|nr:hypothetical protein EYC84_006820 [Monilinia fructicola]
MHQLATSYFDTFNFLYPFMDRQNFLSDTLTKVISEGFDGDMESVIALLIFALGDVAYEGARGNPVDIYRGRPSGIRGGSGSSRPPGLAFFNEAMKRIGCVFTECSLENVQMFSLTALYYQSCSRHMEFWRAMVSASSAWKTLTGSLREGDLIKRAYWHCATMETTMHLDMDLPLTSMMNLEQRIALPLFQSTYCEDDFEGDQQSHWQAHNSSVLALRRICVHIQNGISEMSKQGANSASTNAFSLLSAAGVRQLASQLIQWRGLLPSAIQWPEDNPTSFPGLQNVEQQPGNIDPNLTSQSPNPALFTTNLDEEPTRYPYAYDIQDAHNVAECLCSCLLWPILLSPPSRCKRLIPYLFTWSQIFLGILLIVHLSKHNTMLKEICEKFCGERYQREIGDTVELMLDWIRDLKDDEDPIALWCWNMLRGIYW